MNGIETTKVGTAQQPNAFNGFGKIVSAVFKTRNMLEVFVSVTGGAPKVCIIV